MNNFHLLSKAIVFAERVHHTQKRKGSTVPYVTHPLAVSLMLSRVSDDANIIIAGILHDTIEDCEPYGSVTRKMIEKEFNADIARMVNDVTEQDKTLPWMERKMAAFAHIKEMAHDSLLVKTADVLHNLTDLLEDIRIKGDSVFDKFNADKSNTILRYTKLEAELKTVWPENPLLPDLIEAMKVLK